MNCVQYGGGCAVTKVATCITGSQKTFGLVSRQLKKFVLRYIFGLVPVINTERYLCRKEGVEFS